MAPKKINIKQEDRSAASDYNKKAERRNIFRDEALEIVKITTRFYQWVQECISKK